MSLASIKNFATSKAARQILLTQKHSPKILFAAGTVGVVTATVLACRATLQMADVLDEYEKNVALMGRVLEKGIDQPEEVEKVAAQQKIKTAVKIAKLYAPAVGIGAVSIAALTGSHVILSKRNGAVMAAYAGLDRAYKEYRERVRQEFGEEVDNKFFSGAEDVTVEEILADGSVKKTKKVEKVSDGVYGGSPYAVLFDEKSKFFSREPGMNAQIVGMKQAWANDKLRAQGHLFLNEVHDMLGLPRTKAGACVGWVWRRENEEKTGDNYVSFGVFDGDSDIAQAFIDGDEKAIWLDFNVDGVILDLI